MLFHCVISSILPQAKPDSNRSDVAEVFKKLKTHMNEVFNDDFPFYLLLSYRMHTMFSMYVCDELQTFIPTCISRLEAMDMKTMVKGFLGFIERYVLHSVHMCPRVYTALYILFACMALCVRFIVNVIMEY